VIKEVESCPTRRIANVRYLEDFPKDLAPENLVEHLLQCIERDIPEIFQENENENWMVFSFLLFYVFLFCANQFTKENKQTGN